MKIFLPCIFLVFSAAANNVQYFEEIEDNRTHRDPIRLKSFSWMNCGDPSKSTIVAKSLTVTPDPIQTPGSVNIGVQLTVKTDVNSPMQADLVLYKKLNNQWVKIPCLGFLGSCHYDDLCELLNMISDCPDPIVSSGLGCYCPFKTVTLQLKHPRPFPSHARKRLLIWTQYVLGLFRCMPGKDLGCK